MGVLSKVQKLVIQSLGFANYRKIITSFNRIRYGISDNKWSSNEVASVKAYEVNGRHAFFGYYDLQSMDAAGEKLLSIITDGNTSNAADVGYFSVETGEFHKLAATKAWNWQMGARVRWLGTDRILFNDFDGQKYISRVVDIKGSECNRFAFPLYDMYPSAGVGYYPDFVLLDLFRKGYGYENIPADIKSYYDESRQGLYIADLKGNTASLLYSLEQLKAYKPAESMLNCYHYINHICVNQKNGWLFFFHLWQNPETNDLTNRVVVLDNKNTIVNVLDDFKRASHYVWYDETRVLLTVLTKGNCEYRLYDVLNGSYAVVNGIATDGHPSFVSKDIFITDTYPDRSAMENVYVCNLAKQKYKRIFSIYHNTKKFGEVRCDLHPRVLGNLVNIDSVEGGFRKQYILCLKHEYDKISTDQARINLEPKKRKQREKSSLYACMVRQYLFLTHREKANAIKVLFQWFMSPSFRVNAWIERMQAAKKPFIKRLISNYLETKYSITVCSTAKIGRNFRVDHFHGVVIGPGAIVGDFCKIYQQVTLGQKDRKFPTIGNNVTIYTGAKVIGDITVGDGAIIGANAVVTKDVPAGCVVAGVPAKVIKRRKEYNEFN